MYQYVVKRVNVETRLVELGAESDQEAIERSKDGYGKFLGWPESEVKIEIVRKDERYERDLV